CDFFLSGLVSAATAGMTSAAAANRDANLRIHILRISVHSIRSSKYPLVYGKLVRIQHSPATVSAENQPNKPLFRDGMGRRDDSAMRKSGDRPAENVKLGSRGRSQR